MIAVFIAAFCLHKRKKKSDCQPHSSFDRLVGDVWHPVLWQRGDKVVCETVAKFLLFIVLHRHKLYGFPLRAWVTVAVTSVTGSSPKTLKFEPSKGLRKMWFLGRPQDQIDHVLLFLKSRAVCKAVVWLPKERINKVNTFRHVLSARPE